MQSSSTSPSRSTQIPIKVRHRIAKKKQIRRRRVDLTCGCSYYLAIECANHGFTHRGVHHCSSSAEWRLYLDSPKCNIFQGDEPPRMGNGITVPRNSNSTPVQPQPQESLGDSQMLDDIDYLNSLTESDLAFLESL
ncbi:transcription activation protein [Cowpea golden mosaic virus]|uniref:Transcriptional activator protein n=1 Tax=Cowpea golden mosaic virus TaxID=69263 RepID=O55378_9GEMI|nr:transcription activation protein [Cowpea golden mosaic virus-[Nigeria]]AAB87608.1 transcription activation protein [Cowpea golden mosaic virus-[Nigeria]]